MSSTGSTNSLGYYVSALIKCYRDYHSIQNSSVTEQKWDTGKSKSILDQKQVIMNATKNLRIYVHKHGIIDANAEFIHKTETGSIERFALTNRGIVWKLQLGGMDQDNFQSTDDKWENYKTYCEVVKEDISFGMQPETISGIRERMSSAEKHRASYYQIRNDSFRTFRHDKEFSERVTEDQIVRVCSAYSVNGPMYFQGMNIFAGMQLYVLPELDAYLAYGTMIGKLTACYWKNNHKGVDAACQLVDDILRLLDEELFAFMKNEQLTGTVTSYANLKTWGASSPPQENALPFWDYLLSSENCMKTLVYSIVASIIARRQLILKGETSGWRTHYWSTPHTIKENDRDLHDIVFDLRTETDQVCEKMNKHLHAQTSLRFSFDNAFYRLAHDEDLLL